MFKSCLHTEALSQLPCSQLDPEPKLVFFTRCVQVMVTQVVIDRRAWYRNPCPVTGNGLTCRALLLIDAIHVEANRRFAERSVTFITRNSQVDGQRIIRGIGTCVVVWLQQNFVSIIVRLKNKGQA